MKKPIIAFFAVVMMVCAVSGCDKQSHNGDLDGMWQFMEVNYHVGEEDSTVDLKDGKAYLSFQLDLAQIKWLNMDLDSTTSTIVMRFSHSGDLLTFYDFYRHYRTSDSLFTASDSMLLAPLGFKGGECVFDVITLTSDAMELESDFAGITFRKF